MLIKDEYKLHVGDIVKFDGPSFHDVNKKKTYSVVVKEIYSHWVLGHVIDYEFNDNVILKMCMSNIDLVMQGIYKVEAIKDNAFNVSTKPELSDEQIEKIKNFTDTHKTRLKLTNR